MPSGAQACAHTHAHTRKRKHTHHTQPQGYETYGFSREGNATVYCEWAPAAQAAALIGDFSGWQPVWMEKGDFGVWTLRLPDGGRLSRA